MTASTILGVIGYLLAAWAIGFGMGHLIKFFRNLTHSV